VLRPIGTVALICGIALAAGAGLALAQRDDSPDPTDAVPPPLPHKPVPEDAQPLEALTPESDRPWDLPPGVLAAARARTQAYEVYSKRFVCDEFARLADYDGSGEATKEKVRQYGYLLVRDSANSLREVRQVLTDSGKYKGEVDDPEPFPPAYAWVFLFSRFHEPYFKFRLLETRFEGFDLVHVIQFKGSLAFTDGKDIRQWEGTVLLDANAYMPVEIVAEPAGQKQRIEAMYRSWSQSFNVMGFRSKPAPRGYRARIEFLLRRDELAFPTDLRYDTFRAVGPTQVIREQASTRSYRNYKFTRAPAEPKVGDVVPNPK
jgi:hypothetical protein